MLDNLKIAEHLVRGKTLGGRDYIVGTGVKVRRTKSYIYDETIADKSARWVAIEPNTIEKCVGLLDKVGTPIFDNDVLLDNRVGLRTIVKYSNYDKKWNITHYVSGVELAGDASLLVTMVDKMTVVGHYNNGYLDTNLTYTKPIMLPPYNDEE